MHKVSGFAAVTVFLVLVDTLLVHWSIGTVFSALVTALALVPVYDGLRPGSRLQGVATIALMYWGLSYASNLVEAVAFKVIPVAGALKSASEGLVTAIAAAWLLERLMPFQNRFKQPQARIATGMAGRIPLLVFIFFVAYLAAGIAIQPWIMGFYAGRFLPSLRELAILVPLRGLFDIACVLPWFLQWQKSRSQAVWLSAYVFAALCGWGPLLLPNAYLPSEIRIAHAIEIGAFGIVFGAFSAFLLLKPQASMPKKDVPDEVLYPVSSVN